MPPRLVAYDSTQMNAADKVLVVTGARSGMGREIVLELLRRPATTRILESRSRIDRTLRWLMHRDSGGPFDTSDPSSNLGLRWSELRRPQSEVRPSTN